MGSRPSKFKQSDLVRVLKAAGHAGLTVARFEVDSISGRIAVLTAGAAASTSNVNEWDEVLNETPPQPSR